MSQAVGEVGFVFRANVPGSHNHIVISNPDDHGDVIVVNWTTLHHQNGLNGVCVIHPADHPDIHHESRIAFERSKLFCIDNLINGIQDGSLLDRGVVGIQIVNMIINHALQSDQMRPSYKNRLVPILVPD